MDTKSSKALAAKADQAALVQRSRPSSALDEDDKDEDEKDEDDSSVDDDDDGDSRGQRAGELCISQPLYLSNPTRASGGQMHVPMVAAGAVARRLFGTALSKVLGGEDLPELVQECARHVQERGAPELSLLTCDGNP